MEMKRHLLHQPTHGCVLKATLWYSDSRNILMFNRKYIFIQGPCLIAMLENGSVNYPHLIPTYCTSRIPTTPCYLWWKCVQETTTSAVFNQNRLTKKDTSPVIMVPLQKNLFREGQTLGFLTWSRKNDKIVGKLVGLDTANGRKNPLLFKQENVLVGFSFCRLLHDSTQPFHAFSEHLARLHPPLTTTHPLLVFGLWSLFLEEAMSPFCTEGGNHVTMILGERI